MSMRSERLRSGCGAGGPAAEQQAREQRDPNHAHKGWDRVSLHGTARAKSPARRFLRQNRAFMPAIIGNLVCGPTCQVFCVMGEMLHEIGGVTAGLGRAVTKFADHAARFTFIDAI